jgi:hypothetical protein
LRFKENTIAMAWVSDAMKFVSVDILSRCGDSPLSVIHDVAISPVFYDAELIKAVYRLLTGLCCSQDKLALTYCRRHDKDMAGILKSLGYKPILT